MAKTAADLLEPVGVLDGPVLWPALSAGHITTKLNGYLTQAYAREDLLALEGDTDDETTALQDAAALLWATYLAYNGIYIAMVRRAAKVGVESEGSKETLAEQIAAMKALADAALAEYEDAVEVEDEPTTLKRDDNVSVTTPLNFSF